MPVPATWRTVRSVVSTVIDEPSNRGEVVRRLLMSVGWQLWKRMMRTPLVLTLDNGLLFVADPRSGNSTGAIYTRIYESRYVEFVRRAVVPGGIICDVGAHVGLFTLLVAPLFRGGYCFEPAPDCHELLVRNLALNALGSFRACRQAVSDQPGRRTLVAEGDYSGTARLADAGERAEGSRRAIDVEAVRLDDVLGPDEVIAFLKIDVEGREADVLASARRTLARSPGALVMFEQNGAEGMRALEVLRDIGFRPFVVDALGRPATSLAGVEREYNVFACGPEHRLDVPSGT
jgi:FkbM family methyltransferase